VAGEIVAVSNDINVVKSGKAYQQNMLGVISSQAGIVLSLKDTEGNNTVANPKPVALVGRVPVKLSTSTPAIMPGDYITSSYEPGKGMKADHSGYVIGQALTAYDPASTSTEASVLVFIKPGFANINNSFVFGEDDSQLADATSTLPVATTSLTSFLINQKGSGNILQLQASGQDRFLVATTGSVSILASATSTQNILTVYNGTSTMFAINSVGDVQTTGHIVVGKDTAGTVTIKAGDDQVDVSFDRAYLTTPKVIISVQGMPDFFYGVATKTPTGFKIQVSKALTTDMSFDWVAFEQPVDTAGVSSKSLNVVSAPQDPGTTIIVGGGDITPPPTDGGEVSGTSTPPTTETPPTDTPTPPVTDPAPVDSGTPPATETPPAPATDPVTP
jgi:hypothetical protein